MARLGPPPTVHIIFYLVSLEPRADRFSIYSVYPALRQILRLEKEATGRMAGRLRGGPSTPFGRKTTKVDIHSELTIRQQLALDYLIGSSQSSYYCQSHFSDDETKDQRGQEILDPTADVAEQEVEPYRLASDPLLLSTRCTTPRMSFKS